MRRCKTRRSVPRAAARGNACRTMTRRAAAGEKTEIQKNQRTSTRGRCTAAWMSAQGSGSPDGG
ncbi:hypothetical protein BSLA_02r0762 [Burkholderia stabilis]|nr:hypothetical protein BSLA_02r0762 [Burkholderia stabilis]